MNAEFYQRLLAAELAPTKSRSLFGETGSLVEGELLNSPLLTDKERERARKADIAAMEAALAAGVHLILPDAYPDPLANVDIPPPALFADGDVAALHAPTVAIVGTRDASAYGRACAYKFAQTFARAGVTVVSGGALGIDASAHKGALDEGGATVAVLAGGIDHVYPAVHAPLFRKIRERGCLVSQFAVGSRPNEYKFLQRNALIAMLSLAVVVIEAPYKSGALRTAHDAADIGRDVFVVPGGIDQPNFGGSHHLIRQGATFVDSPNQVLMEIGVEPVRPKAVTPVGSSTAEAILSVLSVQPISTEAIVDRTGLDPTEVLSELTMLELDGRVVRDSVGYATRL